jgi:hypothetical protein
MMLPWREAASSLIAVQPREPQQTISLLAVGLKVSWESAQDVSPRAMRV